MIGKLRGRIDAIGEAHAIVDVGGVGYEVQLSASTLRGLELGRDVSLTIDTHVREDAIRLYGFRSEVERSWFRLLQTVQGVGAKVALGVLGVLAPADLAQAIALGSAGAIEQAPGVGKKLAQRIAAELKDKTHTLPSVGATTGAETTATRATKMLPASAEAISALMNLGYNMAQASAAIAVAAKDLGTDAETAALIRRGLKELARA